MERTLLQESSVSPATPLWAATATVLCSPDHATPHTPPSNTPSPTAATNAASPEKLLAGYPCRSCWISTTSTLLIDTGTVPTQTVLVIVNIKSFADVTSSTRIADTSSHSTSASSFFSPSKWRRTSTGTTTGTTYGVYLPPASIVSSLISIGKPHIFLDWGFKPALLSFYGITNCVSLLHQRGPSSSTISFLYAACSIGTSTNRSWAPSTVGPSHSNVETLHPLLNTLVALCLEHVGLVSSEDLKRSRYIPDPLPDCLHTLDFGHWQAGFGLMERLFSVQALRFHRCKCYEISVLQAIMMFSCI